MNKVPSLVATLAALEKIYDARAGRAGASKQITGGVAGGLIKIQALVAAIETLPAQPGSPFKAAVPSRQKAPASAESVLETYQRLLTEKPREAGQFYAENAEEILAGLAAREREERAALQATYPWNKR